MYIKGAGGLFRGSTPEGRARAARLREHAKDHEEVVGARQEAAASARKRLTAAIKKRAKGKASDTDVHAAATKAANTENALRRAIAARRKTLALAARAGGKPTTTEKAKAAAGRLKELKQRLQHAKQSEADLAQIHPGLAKTDYSRLHAKIAKRERLLDRLLRRESRG